MDTHHLSSALLTLARPKALGLLTIAAFLGACSLEGEDRDLADDDRATHPPMTRYFCPNTRVTVAAQAKMALGAAGYTLDEVTNIAEAYAEAGGRTSFFDDSHQWAGSELYYWVEAAGILGFLDERAPDHRVFPRTTIDKQALAKLMAAPRLVRRDGMTMQEATQYVRELDSTNADVFSDSVHATPSLKPWVEVMGLRGWGNGSGGAWGIDNHLPKGGIAKLMLLTNDVSRSEARAAGGQFFIDTHETHQDWWPFVDYMGWDEIASGVADGAKCANHAETGPSSAAYQPLELEPCGSEFIPLPAPCTTANSRINVETFCDPSVDPREHRVRRVVVSTPSTAPQATGTPASISGEDTAGNLVTQINMQPTVRDASTTWYELDRAVALSADKAAWLLFGVNGPANCQAETSTPLWTERTEETDPPAEVSACGALRELRDKGEDHLKLGVAFGASVTGAALSGWIPDEWLARWGGADSYSVGIEVVWDMYHHEAVVARWRGTQSSVGLELQALGYEIDTFAAIAGGFSSGVETWAGAGKSFGSEVEIGPAISALAPLGGGFGVGLNYFSGEEGYPNVPEGIAFSVGLELENGGPGGVAVPSPLGPLLITPELEWAANETVLAKAETRALHSAIEFAAFGLADARLVDADSNADCLATEPNWPAANDGSVSSRSCVVSFGDESDSHSWRAAQATFGMCSVIGYLPCFTNLGNLPVSISQGLAAYRDTTTIVDALCGDQ